MPPRPRLRPRPQPRRHRRLTLLAAAAVIVLSLAVVLPLVLTGGSSTTAILTRPAAYQIVYRVVTSASGTPSTATETLTVRRPFLARDLTVSAASTSGTLFDLDGLYTVGGDGALQKVSGRQPGPAGSDQALGVILPDLVARGLARDLHSSDVVAGRRCRLIRLFEPAAGPIHPLTDAADHDDVCLDGDGLLLASRWTYRGRLVFTQTATSVIVGSATPPLSPAGAAAPPSSASAAQSVPDPHPTSFLATPPTPAGYRLVQSVRFLQPDPSTPGAIAARSVVWAFAAGPDVITVEAGTAARLPWDEADSPARPVRLAKLGAGESALRSDGPEVRVDLGHGNWVRIRGTVPLGTLVRYAQQVGPATS